MCTKIAALCLTLSLVSGKYLRPSERRDFFDTVTQSLRNTEDPTTSISAGLANYMDQYTSWQDLREVPDWMWEWYLSETSSRSMCDGVCGGFLSFTPIWKYGCWCFFGYDAGTVGRGPAVNEYDEVCKAVTNCYRCARFDGEQEGEACDPWSTDYQADFSHNNDNKNISATCMNSQNSRNCEWRTCSCEMNMIASFFKLLFSPTLTFDESFKHENGFDWELECPVSGVASNRQCCGLYPNRRPYDDGPTRSCCHHRNIYNPANAQCCEDGSTVSFGDSC